MHAGTTDDSAYAEPITTVLTSRARIVIAVVANGAVKATTSRDAMEHCAATSPLYAGWLAQVPRDLDAAEHALATGDLQQLGELAEANALAMHATALAARPAIVYWRPETLALLAEVRALRARGVGAWATIDAGPHVKVLCDVSDAETVAAAVRPLASDAMISAAGEGAM
jgi:diphosphomevalonate decarboxylase